MEEIKTEQTTINNTQTENNINQETLVEGKKPPFKKRKPSQMYTKVKNGRNKN